MTITLTREAGRIDLNRGRADLVAAALPGVLADPELARHVLERLSGLRRRGEELERVAALLDMAERFDPVQARLAEAFTVATAADGFDLAAASAPTLRALHGSA